MITPIFRSVRLCVTACGIMHPRCCQPVGWKRDSSAYRLPVGIIPVHYTTSCNTQSSAPEDGQDHRPKHVELIGIINKPLLLHLIGVYIVYVSDVRSNKHQILNFYFVLYHLCTDSQETYCSVIYFFENEEKVVMNHFKFINNVAC